MMNISEKHMSPVSFGGEPHATYIVDANRLSREGLIRLLEETPFNVVGHGHDIDELLGDLSVGIDPPILVLVVLPIATSDLASNLRQLRPTMSDAKIVLLADEIAPVPMAHYFSAGIDGYLLKDISTEAFTGSLNLVLVGERVFPSELIPLVLRESFDRQAEDHQYATVEANLSSREVQILSSLVDGAPNKIIANRLDVTEATVKVHIKSILRKIKVQNRTQAAIWAVNHGMGHSMTAAEGKTD
jgi:two-component system nitrate/nitrite response regulator NarL